MFYLSNSIARCVIGQLAISAADWRNSSELHTDNRALITALKREDSRGRITRWNSAHSACDFEIKHVKGFDNGLTDALSCESEEDKFDINKFLFPITRSQGPQTQKIRQPGKLDILARDISCLNYTKDSNNSCNSNYTNYSINDEEEKDYHENKIEGSNSDFCESVQPRFKIDTTSSKNGLKFFEYLPLSTKFRKTQQIYPKFKPLFESLKSTVFFPKYTSKQSKSY
ncbi:hypothetical protein AYI68_g7048 [Smittium mucronatum]|uniref:Reverse transcriptase RNase H-like domain-containing protein n=1 Tax=Smittium mucronatum TaxID=133383 RepID=A0A1R0GPT0_9FUNG|nr:hypothetical protein AYI68_g7048 [Smittium mucronatum]